MAYARYNGNTAVDTIQQGNRWYFDEASKKGAYCPCCHRKGKVYPRSITHNWAAVLILLHRAYPVGAEVNVKEFIWRINDVKVREKIMKNQGDYLKLRLWELLEIARTVKNSDGTKTPICRLTPRGYNFVFHGAKEPKRLFDYKMQVMDWDPSKGYADIHEALGEHFKFAELMNVTWR